MEEFEVERIVDKKIGKDQKLYYKIKWRNYPLHEATWEPIDNCLGCAKAISDFEREELNKNNLCQKRRRSLQSSDDTGCDDKAESDNENKKEKPQPHQEVSCPTYLIKRIKTVEEIHGILYANVVLCDEKNPTIKKKLKLTTKKLAEIAPLKLITSLHSGSIVPQMRPAELNKN